MDGLACPVHTTPMDWLSTANQWVFYCRACDRRYNWALELMPPSLPSVVTMDALETLPDGLYRVGNKAGHGDVRETPYGTAYLFARVRPHGEPPAGVELRLRQDGRQILLQWVVGPGPMATPANLETLSGPYSPVPWPGEPYPA